MAESDAQGVPPEHEEEFLYCVGGTGVSLTGGTQEPPGCSPEQGKSFFFFF